jgi:sortase A
MNDKLRKLIRVAVILIGIGILVYPSLSEYLAERNASRAVASYDDTVEKTEQARLDALLEEAREYNRMLASSTGFQKPPTDANGEPISPDSYGRMLNINGDGMMGYITIPKLNVTNRIYHGTDESVLQVAVGHLQNTSLPVGGESSHAVLSGHRGLPTAELFTDLDQLAEGDVFYIKVLDHTLCYTVDQILTVLPDETEELAIRQGEDYVTLVTCTPYGINSHRLLVRGVRTPYDDSKPIPVYEDVDMGSFWSRMPAQYRHMLFGAAAIVAFLIVYWIVILIRKNIRKRRTPEDGSDHENGEKTE